MAIGPGGNHMNVVILFNLFSLQNQCFRSKNTFNILIKNMLTAFIGGIAYWANGWGLGEGTVSNF